MAKAVKDEAAVALVTNFRGLTRCQRGDEGGLDDLRTSLNMWLDQGSSFGAIGYYHLASNLLAWYGPEMSAPFFEEAVAHASRTASTAFEMWARVGETGRLADAGVWDEVVLAADRILAWSKESGAPQQTMLIAAAQKARVLALRGATAEAGVAMTSILGRAQTLGAAQVIGPAAGTAALCHVFAGNLAEARALLVRVQAATVHPFAQTAEICRILIACGGADDARAIGEQITEGPPRLMHAAVTIKAMLAEATGDQTIAIDLYHEAAGRWRGFGHMFEACACPGRGGALSCGARTNGAIH